jgi:hypothetical protein
VGPKKLSFARQQPVNMFPWQPKHTPLPTIPGPLLGNSSLNTSLNNGGIHGKIVFFAVHSKAI